MEKHQAPSGRPPWMASILKIASSNEVPPFPTKLSKDGLDLQRDPKRRSAAFQAFTMADILPGLPIEISLDIFLRLPLETFSCVRLVSKVWNRFFLNPTFTKLYFDKNRSLCLCRADPSDCYLLETGCVSNFQKSAKTYKYKLKEFSKNFTVSATHKTALKDSTLEFPLHRPYFQVVGTVNGLICFAPMREFYSPVPYYICNPITRDYIMPLVSPKIDILPIGSGFGFNALNNEYKLLRILPTPSQNVNVVQVLTLGSDVWREILADIPYVRKMNGSTLLKGFLHWEALFNMKKDILDRCDTILAFDLIKEKFGIMETPPAYQRRKRRSEFGLMTLGECLAVLIDSEELWVMMDYGDSNSWVKNYTFKFTFAWNGLPGHRRYEVNLLQNGQFFLVGGLGFYFDPVALRCNTIDLLNSKDEPFEDFPANFPDYWITFTGSLISPHDIISYSKQALRGDEVTVSSPRRRSPVSSVSNIYFSRRGDSPSQRRMGSPIRRRSPGSPIRRRSPSPPRQNRSPERTSPRRIRGSPVRARSPLPLRRRGKATVQRHGRSSSNSGSPSPPRKVGRRIPKSRSPKRPGRGRSSSYSGSSSSPSPRPK
ncbi:hypothetical protein IFM89_030388 [Coptis chinensis]|uniref:F-box domain-containing protein n=1 Tax=Coptis chinensis TaxID=261450 RepID=A0A835H029_9MAGN|nr:hypothetical protein IFM89_030388 [Coptis chinensis]